MLLLGMGMNLQYALNDYGLAENNGVLSFWVQQKKKGRGGGGGGRGGFFFKVNLFLKDGEGSERVPVFFLGRKNCERNTFSGYVQCDDKESIRCD